MGKRMDLEPQEVDHVVNILADRPWKEVNNLVQKIVGQMNDAPFQGQIDVWKKRDEEEAKAKAAAEEAKGKTPPPEVKKP